MMGQHSVTATRECLIRLAPFARHARGTVTLAAIAFVATAVIFAFGLNG